MNDIERKTRFDELEAGRALGDLDAVELVEWETLVAELGTSDAPALERLATELEIAIARHDQPVLPAALAGRLKELAREKARAREISGAHVATAPVAPPVIPSSRQPVIPSSRQPARRPSIAVLPWLGWAAAACLLAALLVQSLTKSKASPDAVARKAALLARADDVRKIAFAGAGDSYQEAAGEVVWSDLRQEGYMTLSRIPANDPARKQYQLWIVDPARDEIPVDGGVFDIPAGQDSVVIPIQAKLAVRNPAAFVITLEQPGGVVRSKQETVVALAK